MDFDIFLDRVIATFFGNLLFLGYAYFLWRVAKADKRGLSFDDLPVWVLALGGLPLIYFLL